MTGLVIGLALARSKLDLIDRTRSALQFEIEFIKSKSVIVKKS